jgi:NAD(P)-dependent dehydrogenase (short-subunit alcohol dehydrogenase family)
VSGRLAGKIAVITGGTSGIGQATVRLFASEGARVVIVARRRGPGEELVAELGPERVKFLPGDVGTEATATASIDVAEEWGGVDILVNNAAMDWTSRIVDTSEADARRVMQTNFIGAFLMQREAGRKMLLRRRGSIVNVTSRNASVGVPTMAIYAAAKGALLALTRVAAVEWAVDGVRVNAVAPGLTQTPLVRTWIEEQDDPLEFEKEIALTIPQRRMAEPIDVANAILFLSSDESLHITGASLAVDGGYTAA